MPGSWLATKTPWTNGERGLVEVYQLATSMSMGSAGSGTTRRVRPPVVVPPDLEHEFCAVLDDPVPPARLLDGRSGTEGDRVEQGVATEAHVGVPGRTVGDHAKDQVAAGPRAAASLAYPGEHRGDLAGTE